ncbi:MAG TPA: TetR/AcrR family transcriptional regulator [Reyranella sp.]|nr:TetR/AcrR family transcriptional regulator [Reyranella sp.]
MPARSISKQRGEGAGQVSDRQRILGAAFSAFMANGYAETSTLEIATRARVSKRALYELVGNKQEMLVACISERAQRLRVPTDLPEPRDRETLARALAAVGTQLLREISDPTVIAVFRLAIAEAVRAPEVARALDSIGGETSRAAVREIMTRAQRAGILSGDPREMAEHFAGLLWGNLMLGLLLRVVDRPSPREFARRARNATAAFLRLYPQPDAGSGVSDS